MLIKMCKPAAKKICIILASFMLASCSLAPAWERPQTVADTNIQLKSGQAAEKYTFHDLFRNDSSLLTILEQALKNNYDVQEAVARTESVRTQKFSSIFAFIPSVSYSTSKNISMATASSSYSNRPVKQKAVNYQSSLGIDSYEMDIWGKKVSEIQALKDNEESYRNVVVAVHLTLMSDLANAWYEALSMIQVWHILNDKIVMLNDLESRLNKLNQLARLDPVIFSKFLRGKANDEGNLQNVQKQIISLIHQLEYLSGYRSYDLNTDNWKNIVADYSIHQIPQHVDSKVIFNRPDVLAAEWKIKAENGNIGAARAAFLPVFNLFASAYRTSETFNSALGNLTGNWTFTPSVIVPIFNWPKNYANLDYAKTQQKLAVIDYRRTVAQALMDIKEAMTTLEASQANFAAFQSETERQSENFLKIQKRYASGYIDLYSFYEALDIFTTARVELESYRQQVMTNTVVLLKALGG